MTAKAGPQPWDWRNHPLDKLHPGNVRRYLKSRVEFYPYIATCPVIDQRPDQWTNPKGHCSAVLKTGTRIWLFNDELDRDKFVTSHVNAKAVGTLDELF